ncbi:MAG: GTP-binding protein, partial [Nitrospira sp.]|nr:GTP-binding protein [Nitrospira sp.]
MKHVTPSSIRNVAFASYPGAGKTTLCEAIAWTAGAIPSMGTIPQGTTIGDFEPEEVHRHHSAGASLVQLSWQDTAYTIIDCPGTIDFFFEVTSALRAVDGVVLVVSAATGVRSEWERVWDLVQEQELPCLLFVNDLDKDRTNYLS